MKAMLLTALCALVLLGCGSAPALNNASLVSGETVSADGSRKTLPPQQLAVCSAWLKENQNVWRKVVATPPTPVSSLILGHSDGARTYVQFYTGRPGWDNILLIRNFDKDNHLTFSGKEGFSEDELKDLKACIG